MNFLIFFVWFFVGLNIIDACVPFSPVVFANMTVGEHRYYQPGGLSKCGDGSAYGFVIRKGSVNKVMIEMMGGGACWNYQMCSTTSYASVPNQIKQLECASPFVLSFLPSTSLLTNANSPVKDWSVIFVPYCTQDLHMGNNTFTYTSGSSSLQFNHNGANNLLEVFNFVYKEFPRPDAILVSGCSAGALGAVAAERLYHHYNVLHPTSTPVPIGVFSDSELGLVTIPFALSVPPVWGADCVFTDLFDGYENISSIDFWKSTLTIEKFWSTLLRKRPNMTWLIYSSTTDVVQNAYYNAMGGSALGFESKAVYLLQSILQYQNLRVFTVRQGDHCTLAGNIAYQNSAFAQWMNSAVNSIQTRNSSILPQNVVCAECTSSTVTGCNGVVGSGIVEDGCGVCGGNNSLCSPVVPTWASQPNCADKAWTQDEEFVYELPACSASPIPLKYMRTAFSNGTPRNITVCVKTT